MFRPHQETHLLHVHVSTFRQHTILYRRRRAYKPCVDFVVFLFRWARTLSIFLAEFLVSVIFRTSDILFSCRRQKNINEFATRVLRVQLGETVVVTVHDEPLPRVETACSKTLSSGQSRTNQHAHKTRLRSHPMLENSRMVVGVFSDQQMKKNGTEPATTSQRRNETLSHTK